MNCRGAWFGALLAVVLLVSQPVFSQVTQVSQTPQMDRIAQQANTIDESISNSATTMKGFVRGDESGVLSFYRGSNGMSKLVVQLVSLDKGDVTEYYFVDGTVIYVVQACKNFGTSSHNGSIGQCATISENRYYLSDGHLLAWLRGTGSGSMSMREVTAERAVLANKAVKIVRAASLWMAFVDSASTNFERFEAELRSAN